MKYGKDFLMKAPAFLTASFYQLKEDVIRASEHNALSEARLRTRVPRGIDRLRGKIS